MHYFVLNTNQNYAKTLQIFIACFSNNKLNKSEMYQIVDLNHIQHQ